VKVRKSGSNFEQFDYDAPGHLFSDSALPAYDAKAAELMTTRVLDFLRGFGRLVADQS
jgi:hypothetical protein